ncbi:hypothetical protein [Lysinibacter cavernae]|uniref:hypothetical protein n=1 Tax=Lysinibacter cavernae TaxID=1640652 RepID=UPI00360731A0
MSTITQAAGTAQPDPAVNGREPKKTVDRKGAMVDPDRFFVGISAIILVIAIMCASFIFSFTAIKDAARWTGADEAVQVFAAVFIEGSILTFTLTLAIFKWRAQTGNATHARVFLLLFTFVSVAVNFAHTASFWQWDFSQPEAWYGCTMAMAAPLSALVCADTVIRLTFEGGGALKEEDVPARTTVFETEEASSTSQVSALVEPEPDTDDPKVLDEVAVKESTFAIILNDIPPITSVALASQHEPEVEVEQYYDELMQAS